MRKRDILLGLGLALILAMFSFLASPYPDGLEKVAEKHSFIHKAISFAQAPLGDYLFPGMDNEKLSGSLAGMVGVLIVFAAGLGLAKLMRKKS